MRTGVDCSLQRRRTRRAAPARAAPYPIRIPRDSNGRAQSHGPAPPAGSRDAPRPRPGEQAEAVLQPEGLDLARREDPEAVGGQEFVPDPQDDEAPDPLEALRELALELHGRWRDGHRTTRSLSVPDPAQSVGR